MEALKRISLFSVFVILVAAGCSQHQRAGYWGNGENDRKMDRLARHAASLIEDTVQDRDRADQVKALVTELIQVGSGASRQNADYHQRVHTLNAKYDTTPEEFGSVLDEMQTTLTRTAAQIVDLRFKIKEQLTEEEWNALSKQVDRHGDRYWAN